MIFNVLYYGELTKAGRRERTKSEMLLIKQNHALTNSGKNKIIEKRKNHVWESIASERFKIKTEQARKRQEEEASKLSDADKKRIASDLKKALKDYTSAKDRESKLKALKNLGEMDYAVTYKYGGKFVKEIVGDDFAKQLADAADEYSTWADYYW